MKFLTQIITLNKGQYVIQNKVTIWSKLAIWLKILLIICLSLWAAIEHLDYVFNRKIETFIFNLAMQYCMKSLHKIPA